MNNDTIVLSASSGNVTATLNGASSGAFALAGISTINLLGNDGNNTITVDSSVTMVVNALGGV